MSYNVENIQQSPLSFKVILLGDSNVGKTCFIKQFINNQFPVVVKNTCSIDFVTKTYQVDEFSVRLNIFDTAGQQKFRSLTKSYLKGTDAVLFMYSLDNKQTFKNLPDWINFFENQSESKDEVRVLVGTKKDLLEQMQLNSQTNQKISKNQMTNLVEKYHFMFKFETSAKTNKNINLVFQELSRNLIYNSLQRKKSANPIRQEQWALILKRDKEHLLRQQQKNKGCC